MAAAADGSLVLSRGPPRIRQDQAEAPGDSSCSTLFSSPGIASATAFALTLYTVPLLELGKLTYFYAFPN